MSEQNPPRRLADTSFDEAQDTFRFPRFGKEDESDRSDKDDKKQVNNEHDDKSLGSQP
jgi:hypothetical protein